MCCEKLQGLLRETPVSYYLLSLLSFPKYQKTLFPSPRAVAVPMRKLTVSSCLILLVFLGGAGESFALPACPSSGIFHNCFGTWTFDNGNKYVGEFSRGKKHGQGVYTWANGDRYVGEFKDGHAHGQGAVAYVNGSIFIGEWRNGNLDGQGTAARGKCAVPSLQIVRRRGALTRRINRHPRA